MGGNIQSLFPKCSRCFSGFKNVLIHQDLNGCRDLSCWWSIRIPDWGHICFGDTKRVDACQIGTIHTIQSRAVVNRHIIVHVAASYCPDILKYRKLSWSSFWGVYFSARFPRRKIRIFARVSRYFVACSPCAPFRSFSRNTVLHQLYEYTYLLLNPIFPSVCLSLYLYLTQIEEDTYIALLDPSGKPSGMWLLTTNFMPLCWIRLYTKPFFRCQKHERSLRFSYTFNNPTVR